MSGDYAKGVHQKGQYLNYCSTCDSYVELDDYRNHVADHGVSTSAF